MPPSAPRSCGLVPAQRRGQGGGQGGRGSIKQNSTNSLPVAIGGATDRNPAHLELLQQLHAQLLKLLKRELGHAGRYACHGCAALAPALFTTWAWAVQGDPQSVGLRRGLQKAGLLSFLLVCIVPPHCRLGGVSRVIGNWLSVGDKRSTIRVPTRPKRPSSCTSHHVLAAQGPTGGLDLAPRVGTGCEQMLGGDAAPSYSLPAAAAGCRHFRRRLPPPSPPPPPPAARPARRLCCHPPCPLLPAAACSHCSAAAPRQPWLRPPLQRRRWCWFRSRRRQAPPGLRFSPSSTRQWALACCPSDLPSDALAGRRACCSRCL